MAAVAHFSTQRIGPTLNTRAVVRQVMRALFTPTPRTVEELVERLLIEGRPVGSLNEAEKIVLLEGFLGKKVGDLNELLAKTRDPETRKSILATKAEWLEAYRTPESAGRFLGDAEAFLRRRLDATTSALSRGQLAPDLALAIPGASPAVKEAARRTIIAEIPTNAGVTKQELDKWLREVHRSVPKGIRQAFIDDFLREAYKATHKVAVRAEVDRLKRLGADPQLVGFWFNLRREFVRRTILAPVATLLGLSGYMGFTNFIFEESIQAAGASVWPLMANSKIFLDPDTSSDETFELWMQSIERGIKTTEAIINQADMWNRVFAFTLVGLPFWAQYRAYVDGSRQNVENQKFLLSKFRELRAANKREKARREASGAARGTRELVSDAVDAAKSAAISASQAAAEAGSVVEDPNLLNATMKTLELVLRAARETQDRAREVYNQHARELDPASAGVKGMELQANDIAIIRAEAALDQLPAKAAFKARESKERMLRDMKYEESQLRADNDDSVRTLLIGNRIREGKSVGEAMQEAFEKVPVGVTKEQLAPVYAAELKVKLALDAADAAKRKAEREAEEARRAAARVLRGGRPAAPGAPGAAPEIEQAIPPPRPPAGGP